MYRRSYLLWSPVIAWREKRRAEILFMNGMEKEERKMCSAAFKFDHP